jgi:hypothetical protein
LGWWVWRSRRWWPFWWSGREVRGECCEVLRGAETWDCKCQNLFVVLNFYFIYLYCFNIFFKFKNKF